MIERIRLRRSRFRIRWILWLYVERFLAVVVGVLLVLPSVGPVYRTGMGQQYPPYDLMTTHLFVKDETSEQSSTMFRQQRIKDTTKHHFRQHQFISRRDFTSDSSLHLDNIIGGREAQTSEDPLSRLEFFEV